MGVGEPGFDRPQVSISPLIDVSFLLLIFFLVSATLLRSERDLSISVPEGRESVTVSALVVVIGVEGNGRVMLNPGVGELLVSADPNQRDLKLLSDHLEMMWSMAGDREVAVQLRVDEEATQQRVVDVLNCLAKEGVTSVGLVENGE